MKKRSLNELIHLHLMAQEDFNEIARTLVDEKIAEIVPRLEVGRIINMSWGDVDGRFTGFRIISSFAPDVRISPAEMAKRFKISEEVKYVYSSPYWQAAIAAIRDAYNDLPERCRYFERSVCGGDLRFISK